jgi:hypothetical protein
VKPRALLAVAALLAVCAAHAADIYRWVDENGRTQMSDQVPEKYRASAKRMGDSHQYELTPAQRKEADARATRDKQSQAAERSQLNADAQAGAEAAAASAPHSAASDVREGRPDSAAQCRALRAAYDASRECWARFLNANGTTKPGAVETCGPGVGEPSLKCGIAPLPR